MRNRSIVNLIIAGALCIGLGACSLETGDDPQSLPIASDEHAPSPTFSIGGMVVGATGSLVLLNSNGTTLNVTRDGSFAFETPMVSSAIYDVRVAVPPKLHTCVVANGAGTVALADISDVIVTCTPNTYTVSRTITARELP